MFNRLTHESSPYPLQHARNPVEWYPWGEAGASIRRLAPYLAEQGLVGGKPAAYVCTGYACELPVSTADGLANRLATR